MNICRKIRVVFSNFSNKIIHKYRIRAKNITFSHQKLRIKIQSIDKSDGTTEYSGNINYVFSAERETLLDSAVTA